MLEGIKAMHSIGVFHRDLKPGNILVSKDCQLRITDFGLARFMDASTRRGENELAPMTQYVVTRWYRPPELLLAPNLPYGEPVDLWSIGCILAELLRRKPLFPGKSHLNQAQLIFELKGYTSARELGFPVSAEAASFLDKKCRYRKQSIRKYVPDASEAAISLLEMLLAVNPRERPSAEQALQHPFLADAEVLHDYSKTYLTRPSPEYFEFEHTAFTVPELRAMIEHEVEISAADAYRFPTTAGRSGSPGGVKRRKEWQQNQDDTEEEGNGDLTARTQQAVPAAQQSNAVRRTSRQGEEQMMQDGLQEGPPSQVPTPQQQMHVPQQQQQQQPVATRVAKNNANNPFRAQQQAAQGGGMRGGASATATATLTAEATTGGSSKDRPKSSEEISQAAAAYRGALLSSRSDRDLLSEASEAIPVDSIPAGNILAAVRNENPGNVPPGSRTRAPKTPSPKKMDQILQRDMVNKRRFLIQQQAAAAGDGNSTGAPASQGSSYATRSGNARYSLPGHGSAAADLISGGAVSHHQRSLSGTANDYPANQAHGQQVSRFGKLIPSVGAPFPSIASRMSNLSNRVSGGGGAVRRGAGAAATSNTAATASDSHNTQSQAAAAANMHHSNTILHSGSNIIKSEYPTNQF